MQGRWGSKVNSTLRSERKEEGRRKETKGERELGKHERQHKVLYVGLIPHDDGDRG
jgi:hypothetical protein